MRSTSFKIYLIIFVCSIALAYWASIENDKDPSKIAWFNAGKNKIDSITFTSENKTVKLFRTEDKLTKLEKKFLKYNKNQFVFMVDYDVKKTHGSSSNKSKDTALSNEDHHHDHHHHHHDHDHHHHDEADKVVNQDENILLRSDLNAYVYLEAWCPFYISKAIESDDLALYGLDKPVGTIKLTAKDKSITLRIGAERHDSYDRYYYDEDKKVVLLTSSDYYELLANPKSGLISQKISPFPEKMISKINVKVPSSDNNEPVVLYKVLSANQQMGWSKDSVSNADPSLSRFVQLFLQVKPITVVEVSQDPEVVLEVGVENDDKVVDTIKIAKYQDKYIALTTYSIKWTQLDQATTELVVQASKSL